MQMTDGQTKTQNSVTQQGTNQHSGNVSTYFDILIISFAAESYVEFQNSKQISSNLKHRWATEWPTFLKVFFSKSRKVTCKLCNQSEILRLLFSAAMLDFLKF